MSPKPTQGNEIHTGMSADQELDIMLRNHEAQSQRSRVESRLQSQEVQQAASMPPWGVSPQTLPERGSNMWQQPSLPSSSSLSSVGTTLPGRDSSNNPLAKAMPRRAPEAEQSRWAPPASSGQSELKQDKSLPETGSSTAQPKLQNDPPERRRCEIWSKQGSTG